jgi:hypothetical protein
MIEQGKGGEVQWNLASVQLQILGGLLNKASMASLNSGDNKYINWYAPLKTIKFMIISRLNNQERSELKTIENNIDKFVGQINYHFGVDINPQQEQAMRKVNSIVVKILPSLIETYQTKLVELLELKGYLNPLKSDTTSLFNQRIPEE